MGPNTCVSCAWASQEGCNELASKLRFDGVQIGRLQVRDPACNGRTYCHCCRFSGRRGSSECIPTPAPLGVACRLRSTEFRGTQAVRVKIRRGTRIARCWEHMESRCGARCIQPEVHHRVVQWRTQPDARPHTSASAALAKAGVGVVTCDRRWAGRSAVLHSQRRRTSCS